MPVQPYRAEGEAKPKHLDSRSPTASPRIEGIRPSPMSPSRAASPRAYQFPVATPGVMIDSVAWVEKFGSELGAVILGRHAKPEPVGTPSRERGHYCSPN